MFWRNCNSTVLTRVSTYDLLPFIAIELRKRARVIDLKQVTELLELIAHDIGDQRVVIRLVVICVILCDFMRDKK